MHSAHDPQTEIERFGALLMRARSWPHYFKWLRYQLDAGYYIGGEKFEDGRLVYRELPDRRG